MTKRLKIATTGSLSALSLALTAITPSGLAAESYTDVDRAIRPAEDFYSFANNAWLRATRLPEGLTQIDTTAQLRAENARRVRNLIEEAVTSARTGTRTTRPDVRKIADYYSSLLDREAIERRGLAPLADDLVAISRISDRKDLSIWLGRLTRLDDGSNQQTESLWGVWIHQDFHDPRHYAAHLVQGGLGLAGKQAYVDTGADAVAARMAYRVRVAKVLRLAGMDQAELRAERVLGLETAIAATHASRADTEDVFKTDNNWSREDFEARAPGIAWGSYFAFARLNPASRFVVWQPQAIIGGAKLVGSHPLDAWKDYLSFHLIDHYASVLPSAVRPDQPGLDPVAATEAVWGDAIGRLYVERYFPASAKRAAAAMVENLRSAFRQRLATSYWMTPATRAKAQAKLAELNISVGYPQRWTDYSDLNTVRSDAFGNFQRADAFAYRRELAKLTRRVDPGEWPAQLHPQMVGAILAISPNAMQFSAGLLQPPYFDARGDAAANYGSAGAGIAHEMSHSFDEIGNLYDAEGRLGLWWSNDDLTNYRAALASLAVQIGRCEPIRGLYAIGAKVVGESSADLGGMMVAYDAYHMALRGRPDADKHGLTGDQRFFIAYAQRWRRLQTDYALRLQVQTDNHAPPSCRSNLVRNADAWARAYGVRPGDNMFLMPFQRARIW